MKTQKWVIIGSNAANIFKVLDEFAKLQEGLYQCIFVYFLSRLFYSSPYLCCSLYFRFWLFSPPLLFIKNHLLHVVPHGFPRGVANLTYIKLNSLSLPRPVLSLFSSIILLPLPVICQILTVILEQGFSDQSVLQNHLEGFLKQIADPHP